jgi:hypothetical protein
MQPAPGLRSVAWLSRQQDCVLLDHLPAQHGRVARLLTGTKAVRWKGRRITLQTGVRLFSPQLVIAIFDGVGPHSWAARLKPKYANGRRPKPGAKRVAEAAGRSVRTPAARERPAAIQHHLPRVVRQRTGEPAPGHRRMRSRLAAAVEQPPVISRAGEAQEVRAAMSSAGCPPGVAPPAPRYPPPSSSRRENPYRCLVDASVSHSI